MKIDILRDTLTDFRKTFEMLTVYRMLTYIVVLKLFIKNILRTLLLRSEIGAREVIEEGGGVNSFTLI